MTLVAVIDIALDTQRPQSPDASDTEQKLLLQAVLPVTSVKMMGDLAVLGQIVLKVGIEQIQFGTAYVHPPYPGIYGTAGEDYRHSLPVAAPVAHGHGRYLEEILRLIVGHLISLRRKSLAEIAVTVQQADTGHPDLHVAGLLEVVSGEDTQTS